MSIDRSVAATLAESGLTRVAGRELVASLREDSPLAGIGLSAGDLMSISDAVSDAAAASGIDCVLLDADVENLLTVADLVTAIAGRAETQAS